MTASLTLQGDDPLLKALSKLGNKSAHKELMETLASYGVSSTQERFIQKRGPDGQTWKTAGRGGQTLRDTGRLFQSLSSRATEKSAEWGTNVIYAAIHQFGGVIKSKTGKKLVFMGLKGMVSVSQVTMPARPYLGINGEDRAEISNLIQDWMGRPFAA